MHPFLDVSKLTDEEIIEKLGKAYGFMNSQVALGHNPTVMSIREVIQSLEDERQSRIELTRDLEYNKKYPEKDKPLEFGELEE